MPASGAETGSAPRGPVDTGVEGAVLWCGSPPLKNSRAASGSLRSIAPPLVAMLAVALAAARASERGCLCCDGSQLCDVLVEPVRCDPTSSEVGMGDHAAEQREVGRRAGDLELTERSAQPASRCREVGRRRVRDDLGEQRVEARVGGVSGVAGAIDPDACAARDDECRQEAADREHAAVGVHPLCVDAGLDGKPLWNGDLRLRQGQFRQRGAASDEQPGRHQVQPGDQFSHRVLDLQPGIRLDEEELLARVLRDQELEGAETLIVHGPGQGEGGPDDRGAQLRTERGAGGDLDELLVATLDATFPLTDVDNAARPVPEHLDLDVARTLDELLGVELV